MTYLLAHRGSSVRHPENSLAAFVAAVEEAEVVELDVRATSDCELVCVHDATLARTHGDPRRVGQVTWAELHELAPDVPRVRDVLEAVGQRAGWFLDCKVSRPRAIDAVARLVSELGLSWDSGSALRAGDPLAPGTCAFEHANGEVLQAFRSATGAGCVELVSGNSHVTELVLTAPFITAYAQGVVLPDQHATPRVLRLLRMLRLGSYVYTVNDPERVAELANIGASGVFCDDVQAITAG
jgi:glycerophosphoryl diester phosphodiesterase